MGNLVNCAAIIFGSLIGFFIGHKFKEDMKNIIMECAGLFIIIVGVKSTINSKRDIIVLIYLIIGSIIGQIIDIDLKLKNFGLFLEKKFSSGKKNSEKNFKNGENEKGFAKGFSTATILFCTGAMSIVGSINSGLTGDNKSNFRWNNFDCNNIALRNWRGIFGNFSIYLSRIFLSFCQLSKTIFD